MHAHNGKATPKSHQSSLSKLLDYECQYESRESTREEFYQQLFKYKTKLRRDNHALRGEIEREKERVLGGVLGKFFGKIRELNQVNKQLRERHRVIYQAKKPGLVAGLQTPRSPLKTPRSRRSITNMLNNPDNSFSKPAPHQSHLALPRKSLNNENFPILHPKPRLYGRNSLKISQAPHRHEQLTERKMVSSVYLNLNMNHNANGENSNVYNISTFSETNSMRCSVKSRGQGSRVGDDVEGPTENIFTRFVELMLEEEKAKEKEIGQILGDQGFCHRGHEEIYVNNLESQVQKTSQNIQKLQKMLQNYQHEIKKLQLNLTSVTEMSKQLLTLKQTYTEMQKKCKNIDSLRFQLSTKQKRLQQLKQSTRLQTFELPSSIQMMLRLFGVEEGCLNDPVRCKKELRNLVKGAQEKPGKKKLKVKELLDNIREGRKKFRELMGVYQGRIKKLERKLVSLRIHEAK